MAATEPRAPNVRTTDGQVGHSQAMPDERVRVTLADGRGVIVPADRLQPQGDGTYLVALAADDR